MVVGQGGRDNCSCLNGKKWTCPQIMQSLRIGIRGRIPTVLSSSTLAKHGECGRYRYDVEIT